MKRMILPVFVLIALLVFASCTVIVKGDGERHPAYLHALSDLRLARAFLDRLTPDMQQDATETAAIAQINAAIKDIKEAAAEDGKNLNDHPPVDKRLARADRFTKTLELLNKVFNDINREEDNVFAKELKKSALGHINKARNILNGINE
jgi:hypothetical protein